MEKRNILAVLALMLALLVVVFAAKFIGQDEADPNLTITALSVGKADALVLQQGGHTVLIDTGEKDDGDKIVRFLKNQGIHSVDLLVITHFDKDHVGGAAKVLKHLEVNSVLMPDYEGTRPEYDSFMEALDGKAEVRRLTGTDEETIGDMKIRIQAAEQGETYTDVNDLSLVTWVTFGSRKFVFTGDIAEERISELLASGEDLKADWIKMPHHGRYEENLGELLDAVEPTFAVICCSNKHPASEDTLNLLNERQIEVFDTSEESVVTTCDGEQITEVKLQDFKKK